MWGPPSQLDLPYDVRHSLRFKDKHQRPLTDKENSILEKLKKVDPNNFGKKFKGLLTNFVICNPISFLSILKTYWDKYMYQFFVYVYIR